MGKVKVTLADYYASEPSWPCPEGEDPLLFQASCQWFRERLLSDFGDFELFSWVTDGYISDGVAAVMKRIGIDAYRKFQDKIMDELLYGRS